MYLGRLVRMAVLAACGLVSSHAAFIMNFDENGTGNISINGGLFQTFNGSLINDPSSSLGMVLAWNFAPLGITVGEGDGLILDPTGELSDELRFTNSQGGTTGGFVGNIMIVYSSDISRHLLADTGLPSNRGSFVDTSEDATGHFTYSPSPNTYNGFSGVVPEPATLTTLGVGLAALGLIALRRRS